MISAVTTAGETAVLLCVPEAEPLVGAWRSKGDPAAALGIPAHVTLLYPFVAPDRVDDGVLAEVQWFFTGVDPFEVRFEQVRELGDSGVLYLDPAGEELDLLAEAFARRWPETPPYRGAVDKPHAHLTVVHSQSAAMRAAAAADLQPHLPLVVETSQAALWQCDGSGTWSERAVFAFGR